MRCKMIITIGILSAGLMLAVSFSQEQNGGPQTGKLLRTDLLNFDGPPLMKSLRNIFVPFQGGGQSVISGGPEGGADRRPGVSGKEALSAGEAGVDSFPSLPRIDLRYIGYVGNEERLVALIFREGEAIAVKREDILPDGVKIIRISSEEVEVELPGGENIKFSLEGDEK